MRFSSQLNVCWCWWYALLELVAVRGQPPDNGETFTRLVENAYKVGLE
eukprot:SAG31_NODE_2628_length_5350_cov_48.017901_2_plen_48_part_00